MLVRRLALLLDRVSGSAIVRSCSPARLAARQSADASLACSVRREMVSASPPAATTAQNVRGKPLVEIENAVAVIEVQHVPTTTTDHQGHAVAGEPPPAVLTCRLLLELSASAERARKLGLGHHASVENHRQWTAEQTPSLLSGQPSRLQGASGSGRRIRQRPGRPRSPPNRPGAVRRRPAALMSVPAGTVTAAHLLKRFNWLCAGGDGFGCPGSGLRRGSR